MSRITTAERIVYRRDRGSALRMTLVVLVFFAGGLWMALSPESFDRPAWFVRSVGIAMALFCGVTLPVFAGYLRPGPAVVLSPQGLTVNVGPVPVSDLAWSRIAGVSVSGSGWQRGVNVVPEDPAGVIGSIRNPIRRAFAGLNWKSYGAFLLIPTRLVDAEPDDLASTIERYRSSHARRAT